MLDERSINDELVHCWRRVKVSMDEESLSWSGLKVLQ